MATVTTASRPKRSRTPAVILAIGSQSGPARVPYGTFDDGGHCSGDGAGDWSPIDQNWPQNGGG